MNFTVFEIFRRVNWSAESNIALLVDPDAKRFKICPENPLPNIEFFPPYYQRSFNVFLNHPRNLASHYVIENFKQVIKSFDASASGHASRFDDPDVVAIERPLRIDLFQLFVKRCHLFEELLLEDWLSFLHFLPCR